MSDTKNTVRPVITVGHYNVRIIKYGQRYGRNDSMTHNDLSPIVEFFDNRADKAQQSDNGYFLSRYYIGDVVDTANLGILLEPGDPDWVLNEAEHEQVNTFIREQCPEWCSETVTP